MLIGLVAFGMGLPVRGVTIVGSWDFNSSSLARSQGTSGTMTTELVGYPAPSYQTFTLAGTTVNAQPLIPAGQSLSFVSLFSIVEAGTVSITGLNFTGLRDIMFSFAIADDSLLTGTNSFAIDYDAGSGWQSFGSFAEPGTTFTSRSFDLSSITALNGATNAGIRIGFAQTLNIIDVLSFDNVTVTAVPEPQTLGLLGAVLVLLAIWRFIGLSLFACF